MLYYYTVLLYIATDFALEFRETYEPYVLIGTVVVTKNPCMHPGDVRKFEAVDVPELHHLKDCIVFPAKGKRPHPDEMAGNIFNCDSNTFQCTLYDNIINVFLVLLYYSKENPVSKLERKIMHFLW